MILEVYNRGFTGDKAFLSNYYPCKVRVRSVVYDNAEAAFQSLKCANIEDRKRFRHLNGFEAKKLANNLPRHENWEIAKLACMFEVVAAKFNQNPSLMKKLIDTGDELLIYENPLADKYFGFYHGQGRNYLGKILMEIRKGARDIRLEVRHED